MHVEYLHGGLRGLVAPPHTEISFDFNPFAANSTRWRSTLYAHSQRTAPDGAHPKRPSSYEGVVRLLSTIVINVLFLTR